MGLGVSGLMSGLDTDSIISKLMDLERRPILQLQKKEAGYQAKITALGQVKSAMSDLKSAVEALKKSDGFMSYSATSSDTDILEVSAGDDVVPGNYNITVSQLASAQSVRSAAFGSSDAVVGTGTLTIQVGSGSAVNIEIDSEHNTLSDIAQAINESDAEVTAGVINDGSGNFYLTLQSQKTGTENTISLTMQDDDGSNTDSAGLSSLYADPASQALTETQAAANAQLTVNGISVERSSNEISDLVDGLTINLKSADTSKTVTVSTSKDFGGIKNKLESFVKSYNALIDTLKQQTGYNAATKQGGTLLGDSTVSRIGLGLSRMVYETVEGIDKSVNSLSKLGIEMDDTGHLSLDTGKLTKAMETHPDDVATFFTSDETGNEGIAVRLSNMLDGYLKGSTGIFSAKMDGLQKSIDKIEDQIERINDRLAKREENLRHQFNTLEDLLAQFQQTSGQLDQQLTAIKNLNSQIAKSRG